MVLKQGKIGEFETSNVSLCSVDLSCAIDWAVGWKLPEQSRNSLVPISRIKCNIEQLWIKYDCIPIGRHIKWNAYRYGKEIIFFF